MRAPVCTVCTGAAWVLMTCFIGLHGLHRRRLGAKDLLLAACCLAKKNNAWCERAGVACAERA
jgi:hypothetical protein